MDVMDLASALIGKVTKGYGKKIRREKTAPEIPAAFPTEIRGKHWRAGFAREQIIILRRTKRGEGESDIRPAIRAFSAVSGPEAIELDAVVSAQEPTLNPDLLVSALRQLAPALAPDFARFTRVAVYDAEMRSFE